MDSTCTVEKRYYGKAVLLRAGSPHARAEPLLERASCMTRPQPGSLLEAPIDDLDLLTRLRHGVEPCGWAAWWAAHRARS